MSSAQIFRVLRADFRALRADFRALRATFLRGRGDPVLEDFGVKSAVLDTLLR